MKQYNLKCISR